MSPSSTTEFGYRRSLAVILLFAAAAAADDNACPMNASEPAPVGAHVVNDTLWAGRQPERPYPPSDYRPVPGGGYVLCSCTGRTKSCVRKCCKPNMTYNVTNRCMAVEQNVGSLDNYTVPKFVNAIESESYDKDRFHLVYGRMTCAHGRYLMDPLQNEHENFRISESGWLLNGSGPVIAEPGQFCLEKFSKYDYKILPVVCSQEKITEPTKNISVTNLIHVIAMVLSLPFLFSTLLVYALVRELRNLHGKSLMCHVASLLMAYTSLIIIKFTTDTINRDFCINLAYIMQYSFLATFFWLNVMCFDLWWTFSGFRPLRGNLNEREAKKFIIYSIYAWGCPCLISGITFLMQRVSPNTIPTLHPQFGIHSCWFGSKIATLFYFYGPAAILLFSNLLMFIYTTVIIVRHMRNAKVLNGSESNRTVDHEKQRFMLYLKLFIVMGVNWLAEVISWATDNDDINGIWYVTDIGNSAQGVFIFLIFICKKRVLRLLNKKLCPQYVLFKTSTILSRTTNSTTSRNSIRNKDMVEMTPKYVTNSTSNQLHDFKV